MRIWRRATAVQDAVARATWAIERVGLKGRDAWPAGMISHGDKRKLELAMLLAADKRVLLLDEPMAGVSMEDVPELSIAVFFSTTAVIAVLPSVRAIRAPSADATVAPTLGLMTVRVRMAPSPTGFLHIGGVRTFLFNWLFARGQGGECLLRIENTDTSREVAEAVGQIEESLRWLGIEWDGETRFQLDGAERCRVEAARLVAEGKAYEDDGAIRIRMPKEGVIGWDDAIKGRIEFPAAELEDMVILRSDGRPVYNFASPVDDWVDGITHVIRGDDHVSNTPKQIVVLEALGAALPIYAHAPNIFGDDGKKLSKRHGAQSIARVP